MKFRISQHIPAPLEAVEAALVDPAFLAHLSTLPDLGRVELLDQQRGGSRIVQRVRYGFVGELSSAVRAVVDPARLTWVEESTLDRQTHCTTWRVVPDHYPRLLGCSGTFQLEPEGSAATHRRAEGEVRVSLPFVGGKVESAIVSGLREHADLEARALAEWLVPPGH